MSTKLSQLAPVIRAYVNARVADLVTAKFTDEDYMQRVRQMVVYKYKSWEWAIAEASRLRADPEASDDDRQKADASALDARAEFIDTMREYSGIDLISFDEETPEFPPRPATYDHQMVKTRNMETGEESETKVLVKVTSDNIPQLNYPTPLFTGHSLREFKKQMEAIARKVNEAKAATNIQAAREKRAGFYGDGGDGVVKLSAKDVTEITEDLVNETPADGTHPPTAF